MRVINDQDKREEVDGVDPFRLLVATSISCLATVSALGVPFAAILCHRWLPNPFSKFAFVFGIALAIPLFEISAFVLVFLFFLGMIVQECVERELSLIRLLQIAMLTGILGPALLVSVYAFLHGSSPLDYWLHLSQWLADGIIATVRTAESTPAELEGLIRFQLPFAACAGVLISAWLSVGLAAHLNFFIGSHPFAAGRLRDFLLGRWVIFVFLAVIVLRRLLSLTAGVDQLASGIELVLSIFLYIQGGVEFSRFVEKKELSAKLKSICYVIFSTIGFYVLVFIGGARLLLPIPGTNSIFRRIKNESHFA